MKDPGNKYLPPLLIVAAVLLGFWQITFLAGALKWDLIDVVFPFRYHFSECIRNGIFPFWNPYQQTGTPFFADLQAPTFYPELLLVSLLGGYGVYVMHFLFVLYAVIAAFGMYRLSIHFNSHRTVSALAGISYALSGFIIGHGQHFFLLVGAAWIPWVIVNYLQLLQSGTFRQALKTAVFVFLMISGAYQALSFALLYLLLLLFAHALFNKIWSINRREIKTLFMANLQLLLMVVVFSLPLIVSTIDVLSAVDRLSRGIDLGQSLQYSQKLKAFLSFLLPFSSLKFDASFGGADVSMRNHYFGILFLLFSLLALLRKHSVTEYMLLAFGAVLFLSSFDFLPVREFLFRFVPFMNLFKYAAYIRVFGTLAFILFAANYLAKVLQNFESEKRKLFAAGAGILLVFTALLVFALQKTGFGGVLQLLTEHGFQGALNAMDFYQSMVFQSVFQLVILTGLLVVLLSRSIKKPGSWLVFLVMADLLVAARLNMNFTVTSPEYKPFRMKKDLALCPKDFPVPVNDKIIYNNQQHVFFQPFWRNTYTFTKQVSFGAFSSFELNSFSKLDDEFPNLRNTVLNNHLLYFSDRIFPLSRFSDSLLNPETDAAFLFLNDEDYRALQNIKLKRDSTDIVKLTEFAPTRVIAGTQTRHDQMLTLLQTNFKGWKAFIDDKEVPVFTSNFNYRTVFLPAGTHSVRFEYRNNRVLFLYIFSNVAFFFSILYLVSGFFQRGNRRKRWLQWILPLIAGVLFLLGLKPWAERNHRKTVQQVLTEKWAAEKEMFSFEEDFENNSEKKANKNFRHISSGDEYFDVAKISNQNGEMKAATLVFTADVSSGMYPEALIVSEQTGPEVKNGWHAARIEKQVEHLNSWNKIIYQQNFYNLGKGDEIKIFIWNPKKSDFNIDNISVKLYPLVK